MLKSMTKYRKWILVVGGSLLMVAFLLPEAIRNIRGNPMNDVLATALDGNIRRIDLIRAEREFQALTSLAPDVMLGFARAQNGTHWLLLSREAERAGLVGGERDGREWVSGELAMQMVRNTVMRNPQLLQNSDMETLRGQAAQQLDVLRIRAAGGNQLTEPEMDKALARLRGVIRLMGSYAQAARYSDRRAIAKARELGEQAVIDYVAVSARDLAGAQPAPTPEEVLAHFERFKDTPRGQGEFGIGYKLPARVKARVLTLDMDAIKAAVRVDPVEVRKTYLSDRAAYPGEFEAERGAIEAAMRTAKASSVMQDAVKLVQAEVRQKLQRLDQEGQHRVLPADWDTHRPSLEAIAAHVVESVRSRSGIEIPAPVISSFEDRWYTQDELSGLAEFANSGGRAGNVDVPMAAAALMVKELPRETAAPIAIQARVPFADAAFVDRTTEARRFLEVTAARGESPPDSPAELGDVVVNDLRALRAFEALKGRAAELRARAASEGLEGVAKELSAGGGAPAQVRRLSMVSRRGLMGFDPLITLSAEGSEAFGRAVLETAVAAKIDPLAPIESPLRPGADEARSLVVPLPGTLGVVVAQVVGKRPVTREMFGQQASMLASQLGIQELQDVTGEEGLFEAFSEANVTRRLGLRWAGQENAGAKKDGGATPAPQTPATAG